MIYKLIVNLVTFEKYSLIIEPALIIPINIVDSYYSSYEPEFNLHVHGKTKLELIKDLESQIQFIYEKYGLCDDELLSIGAKHFKYKILKWMTCVPLAILG